ncbi:MAG: glycosyltransferase [Flavobacteriaceae bacterium]|nr:glycosyltransferase [Flavobacteriaceae bacterium]
MISVLIPVYNWNIVQLVEDLFSQLTTASIPFEIICLEDGSDLEITTNNARVAKLKNVKIFENQKNNGVVKARQFLSQSAKYDNLLFLDADVQIPNSNFIENYLKALDSGDDGYYGGILYSPKEPEPHRLLRWKYGRSREQVSAEKRNQNPYKFVISGNFLFKKSVFLETYGSIKGKRYGFDTFFGALLKDRNIQIRHIDNGVYHLGLDSNEVYLKKKEKAALALIQLYKEGKISSHDNQLLRLFEVLHRLNLHHLFAFYYRKFNLSIKKQLIGPKPSVNILQIYRISYICYAYKHLTE